MKVFVLSEGDYAEGYVVISVHETLEGAQKVFPDAVWSKVEGKEDCWECDRPRWQVGSITAMDTLP